MAYDGSLKFDTKVDQSGFEAGIGKLKSTAMAAIGAIGGAFATGAIAKAMISQIKLTEQYGSAINDQAQRLSVSVKKYQELSYIFEQTGGSADSLQMGIKTLSSAVVDGNKAFEQLGISLEDARKMSQEDLFDTVITALASMEESSERTALATDLLGRSATELNPLLNMGAEGLAKMRQEAQNYGIIMSDAAVAATDKYGDAVTLAQKTGDAFRNAMVGKMLPALTDIALGFADIGKEATAAFNERGIEGVVDVITDRFPVATAAVAALATAFATMLIVRSVQKAVQTLVSWQTILNAVMAVSPVLVLATAFGILAGGVVLLEKNYERLHPEITQAINDAQALTKSVKESQAAFKDSTDEIDSNQRGAESLISTLAKLSSEYTGTNIEQRKMQAIVDTLNGSVDNLNLSFNAQTGELSMTTDALNKMVQAQYDAAKAAANLNRYTRLLEEQADAAYAVEQAQKAFYAMGEGSGASTLQRLRANKALRDAKDAYKDVTAELSDMNETLRENAMASGDSTQSLNLLKEAERGLMDSTGELADKIERVIIGGYDFTDSLDEIGMTADEVSGRLDNFTGAAQNMFEKINTKSKISVKSMIDNLNSNTAAIEQWGANIVILGDKLPSDLLQPLIDQGPEQMAGVLNNLAGASDEQLASLSEAFANGGDAAKQAWLDSLGAGLEEDNPLVKSLDGVVEAATKTGNEAGDAIIAAIQSKDYSAATNKMSDSFTRSFNVISAGFKKVLTEIHYNLAQTIGGVAIDIAAMAYNINYAMSKIKTRITIHVNVVYDGGAGQIIGGTAGTPTTSGKPTLPTGSGSVGTLQQIANTAALYDPSKILANTTLATPVIAASNSTVVNAPITVAGVVESDTQLARRITNQFTEVVMYGR